MRSKYFKQGIIGLSEEEQEAIKIIIELSDEALNEIVRWINDDFKIEPRNLDPYYYAGRIEKVNELCSTCQLSRDDFFKVFKFSSLLFRKILELDDDLYDIISDLSTQKIIKEENKEKIIGFLQRIENKCKEMARQNRRDSYEVKSVPVLKNIDYSVELRLVPQKPFEPFEVPIEDYQPKADELIVMTIIELAIADGTNYNITNFQLNFAELEGLIVRLQACQKEMRLLQRYSENHDISKFDI